VFSRKVLVRLFNAINDDIGFQEIAIVGAVKYITYSITSYFILMTVGQGFDHGCILEKGLEVRDDGNIYEEAPGMSLFCVAGLMAKRTVFMMFVLANICDTGVDAAVVVHWLDARKNSKAVENDPFRVYGNLMSKGVLHLIECVPRHVAHHL